MADTKISALDAAGTLDGTELVPVVKGGVNKRATPATIKTYAVGAGSVSVASGKTLTASNTLTLAGTDGSTLNVGAGGTLGALATATPGTGVATAAANAVDSASGLATTAGGVIRAATVTLTAADLADLHNTPVELVLAPGAGKVIVIVAIAASTSANGGTLPGGGYPWVKFDDASGPTASVDLDLTVEKVSIGSGAVNQYDTAELTTADVVNQPLVLGVTGAVSIPGAIATSSIGAAGTGYAALDELAIGDAVIRVDTVGGGGEVLTYTITDAGTNNILGAAQATSGGSGADFTLDIDTLDYSVNPMTLTVKTLYTVMDV